MYIKSSGALALHVLTAVAVLVLLFQSPRCGEDECLRDLFLIVSAVIWAAALALIVVLLRAGGAGQAVAWLLAVLWVPLAWATAIALFMAQPSLGGA